MAEPLVSDALWAPIAPLLPERPPRPRGGRPPLDDRKALEGVVFVLRTGIPRASLPQQVGCGRGRRVRAAQRHPLGGPAQAGGLGLRHDLLAAAADWQAARVFERLHRALLD